MSANLKGVLLASTTALMWGFLPLFLLYALQFSDPFTIVAFRFFIAFVLLAGILWFRDPGLFSVLRRPGWLLVIGAVCLGLNYMGYMKGVELGGAESSQILIQMAPLLFTLVGVFVFKETLSRYQVFGFLLAGFGFYLFYQELIVGIVADEALFQQGSLWIVFAAVTWVFYATANKISLSFYKSQQINLVIYLICSLMYFPTLDFGQMMGWTTFQWLVMVGLGVNTLLAYGAFAEAVRWISAPKVSIIITLNPIITLLVMKLLSTNAPDWVDPRDISLLGYFGAFLVIVGAVFVSVRKRKKAPSTEAIRAA